MHKQSVSQIDFLLSGQLCHLKRPLTFEVHLDKELKKIPRSCKTGGWPSRGDIWKPKGTKTEFNFLVCGSTRVSVIAGHTGRS